MKLFNNFDSASFMGGGIFVLVIAILILTLCGVR